MRALSRRSVLLGAMAAPFGTSRRAHAQAAWPAGTIRLVIPYPPAGSTDVIARLVQPDLQQRLGATVIVENRPGASGSVGTAAVAKSPPDGNSWLIVFDNHAANPFVLGNLPYDTEKDLDPVLLIGTAPYAVSTHPQKPFKTLADVIAAAKAKPDTISYASVGSGSIGHLAMALLSKQAGIRMVHVPYRGGGPAVNDAVAGHVDLLVGSTALSIPQVQAGTLRAVAQTGKTRASMLAQVPTVAEGGFPGFEAYAWWGVFAPAGTPQAVIARFGAELTACLREPRVAKQLTETQQVSLTLGGPEELRRFVSEQMRVWGAVAREHDIKAE
ncbi:MAG TPA: tripartite tricarboxylate transporter substrate binding protein [Xanthobacteraceae bacterium]|nr:tripartite tricarboxylate transporter substrate binding protein [Xanthobacteraceae bacterium]